MGIHEMLVKKARDAGIGLPPISPSPGDALQIAKLFLNSLEKLKAESPDAKGMSTDQLSQLCAIVSTTRECLEHWLDLADKELERIATITGLDLTKFGWIRR